MPNLLGIVTGEVETAARDLGRMISQPVDFTTWAAQQAALIERSSYSNEQKALCSEIILELGSSFGALPIGCVGETWVTEDDLRRQLRVRNELVVFFGEITQEDYDDVGKELFEREFALASEVLFVPTLTRSLKTFGRRDLYQTRPSFLKVFVENCLKSEWGKFDEGLWDDYTIGNVCGADIIRDVTIYERSST